MSIFTKVELIKIYFRPDLSKPVEVRVYHFITEIYRINGEDLFRSAHGYNYGPHLTIKANARIGAGQTASSSQTSKTLVSFHYEEVYLGGGRCTSNVHLPQQLIAVNANI